MAWWSRVKGWFAGSAESAWSARTAGPRAGQTNDLLKEKAKWIPAAESPFGVPVLDLISVTGELISTSQDPNAASMAISWGSKTVADLSRVYSAAESIETDLRYPIDGELSDGFLYLPREMEQKYVLAYRDGQIVLGRSWTGAVQAVAHTRREAAELVVFRLDLADTALKIFGDPVETFDWIVRAHALGQVLPLPVNAGGAQMLENMPLSVFSQYGKVARCAATSWSPPPPERPLRSINAMINAVRAENADEVARLAAAGQSLDVRSPPNGFTPLHIAAAKGNVELARRLLDLGANPNLLADRNAAVIVTAIVYKAPLAMFQLLLGRGADPKVVNEDGFGAVHAVAEVDYPEPLALLLSAGLSLEERTLRGYTPLHIAAALGHVAALNALLEAGASPSARAPDGNTARDIAVAEGKSESRSALDAWQARASR